MRLDLSSFTHWRLSTHHDKDSGWIELFNLMDCDRCGKMVRYGPESTPWVLLQDDDMRYVREHLKFVPADEDTEELYHNEVFGGAVCVDCDFECQENEDEQTQT